MTSRQRVALVTGGMGGLGEAIAHALNDAGHAVIVTHSPGNDHVRAWLDAQANAGRRYRAYGVDVADYDDCARNPRSSRRFQSVVWAGQRKSRNWSASSAATPPRT